MRGVVGEGQVAGGGGGKGGSAPGGTSSVVGIRGLP